MTLYFGGTLVLLGLVFDDLVQEVALRADPLFVVGRWLLPLALVYTGIRVLVDSGLQVNPRPYQHLPVQKSTLVAFLSVLSLFSLWNAVPLAFLVTVCVDAAFSGEVVPALRLGLAGLTTLAIITYVVPMLRKIMSDRPFVTSCIMVFAIGITSIGPMDVETRVAWLPDVSGWLLGGIVYGRMVSVGTAVTGLAGTVFGYAHWLKGEMALDVQDRSVAPAWSGDGLDRLTRGRPASREAVLMARLFFRNSQTRLMVLLLPVSVGLSLLASYTITSIRPITVNILITGVLGTGLLIFYTGSNLIGYDGKYFDGISSRPVSVRTYILGRLLFLFGSAFILFLVPLPVMVWLQDPFLLFHISRSLFK